MSRNIISKSIFVSFLFVLILTQWACKMNDEMGFSAGEIHFSQDTVSFDTLFAERGSKIYTLKVYNRSDKNMLIHQLLLRGRDASPYHMNVDGDSGNEFTDITVLPKDSLYVFLKAHFPATDKVNPQLNKDSIQFVTDAGSSKVILVGWNQNVQKMPVLGSETTTLNPIKPYLVTKEFLVPQGKKLVIPENTRLYFDLNASLRIAGSLTVDGSLESPVSFFSSNLDTTYREVPNQWKGIYFEEYSRENRLSWCFIRNGKSGLVLRPYSEVNVDHVKIEKMMWSGIHAMNAKLEMENSLVAEVRYYGMLLEAGGDYQFNFCTLANYKSYSLNGFRTDQTLVITDKLDENSPIQSMPFQRISWTNSIVEGAFSSEIDIRNSKSASEVTRFDHCLIKANLSLPNEQIEGSVVSEENSFENSEKSNYHLSEESAAKGMGREMSTKLWLDLDGHLRGQDNRYDVGCYRWFPPKEEKN